MKVSLKIVITFLFVTFIILSCINVQAAGEIFDAQSYKEIYKLSEQKDGVLRPFIKFFNLSAVYDKDVNHSGVSLGSKTISVTEKLSGVQTFIASDTVTISGTVENALIIASNVVIEGQVTGDILIISNSTFITDRAKINGDLVVISERLELKGLVEGNVLGTIANETYVSGVIQDDFRIISEQIILQNEEIKGDIYIETNSDIEAIKEKYPEATITKIVSQARSEIKGPTTIKIVSKGIISVITYTAICWLITKKDNNIATKMTEKFKKYTMFSVIAGILMVMLIMILPIILIIMSITGLGIISWPIMIAYFSILFLSISISRLLIGTVIYELVKGKVKKLNVLVMASIFAGIYILSIIPYISGYVLTVLNMMSLGIVVTHLFRNIKEEKLEDKVEIDKKEKQ